MPESRYKADIANASLKRRESRLIAGLLLDGVSDADWKRAMVPISPASSAVQTKP